MRPRFNQLHSTGSTPEDISRQILRSQILHRLNQRCSSIVLPMSAMRWLTAGQNVSLSTALWPSPVPAVTENTQATNNQTQNHPIAHRPSMFARSSFTNLPTYPNSTLSIPEQRVLQNQMTSTKENKEFEENLFVTAPVKSDSQLSNRTSKRDGLIDRTNEDYTQLIGESYSKFMDYIIDMSETNTDENDEEKYKIFKIPPPTKDRNSSQKSTWVSRGETRDLSILQGKTITGQDRGENNNKLKRRSTDPEVLFDRGKTRRNEEDIESLVHPKDDTEWKDNSMIYKETPIKNTQRKQCKSEVYGVSCSEKGQQSANERIVSKDKKTSKKSYSSLDTFKDYTEWKNFMDYGTTSSARGSSNNEKAQAKAENINENKISGTPNDVIVIRDAYETELRKEKFWSGQDRSKSCLGLNLHIPRPRQLRDDGLTTKKQDLGGKIKIEQDFCCENKNIPTSMNPSCISNSIMKSQKAGQGKKESIEWRSDRHRVVQNTSPLHRDLPAGYDTTPKHAEEAPFCLITDNSKDSENLLRQMAINLAERPMSTEEADSVVKSLMREDVLNKPAEDIADFILELINKSAPCRK